jgi:hypothetical protein
MKANSPPGYIFLLPLFLQLLLLLLLQLLLLLLLLLLLTSAHSFVTPHYLPPYEK